MKFQILETIDSTNSYLIRALSSYPGHALAEPFAVMAKAQTAGRGRNGKTWSSGKGGLYFSMAYPYPNQTAFMLPLTVLPLAIGLGTLQSLLQIFPNLELTIKWPNDLLLRGSKCAGILCESVSLKKSSDQRWVVIGMGLNVANAVTGDCSQEIISLADVLKFTPPDPESLAELFLTKWKHILDELRDKQQSSIMAVWPLYDHLLNQQVVVSMGANTYKGVACGIDDNGALLLRVPGSVMKIYGGDVSVLSFS